MSFTLSTAAWVDDIAVNKGTVRTVTVRAQLGDVPTRTEVATLTIPAAVVTLQTSGQTTAGDGLAARYKRVDADPGASADKVRSADRFISDGTVDNSNGGWWLRVSDLSGEEIVSILDDYLGSSDWRTGGGGSVTVFDADVFEAGVFE